MTRLLIVLLVLVGCGLPADTVREIEIARDGALAVALAPNSSEQERETAITCHDCLWDVLYVTGEVKDVPSDVRLRKEQRAKRRAEHSASVAEGGSR